MKTIGSRLTALYVLAVACTTVATFVGGRRLLLEHLRAGLDESLRIRFAEIGDRIVADTDPGVNEYLLLLPGGTSGRFFIEVEDRWKDAAYRSAQERGLPVTTPEPRFFDGVRESQPVRTLEVFVESLQVRLSTPLAPVQEAVGAYTRLGLAIMLAVLAASGIAGALLARAALRPVRAIEATAKRISSDNLSERIPVSRVDDEISRLARLLNATFDRLEASFEQIKRFTAEASHELKTPLSLIRLHVEQVVLEETLNDRAREQLLDAVEETHQLEHVIEGLLFVSRAHAGEVVLESAPYATEAFIEDVANDAGVLAEARGVSFSIERNDAGAVVFDRSRIRQVLLNLVSNALKVTPAGGRIELVSERRDDRWHVSVADTGPGIPADKLEAIFDRFVRLSTDESQPSAPSGAGLGLTICRSIVQLHGGRIWAENRTGGRGALIQFCLPCTSAGTPARKARAGTVSAFEEAGGRAKSPVARSG